MTQKVYAAMKGAPRELLESTVVGTDGPPIGDCPSPGYRPKHVTTKRSGLLSRAGWRFYYQVIEPMERSYTRLSWTTRHTINAVISLYSIVYIFLTVPFRIAFYYNPYEESGIMSAHGWTVELSIYAVMDAVADIIGLVQFVQFYRSRKNAFSRFSTFDKSKWASRDSSWMPATKPLAGIPSFNEMHRGKAKWTLASIERLAISSGDKTDNHHSDEHKHNIQLALEITALLPVEIFPYISGMYNTLHLVRLTKLCRLYKLRRCLKQFLIIYSDRYWVQQISSTGIDSLVRNIGMCAGLCHWVACGYMMVAHAQCGVSLESCDENVETSWVVRDRLFGATTSRKYARTLYWASRTMVLLGYNDVTPVSNAETLYAIGATLLGAIFGSSLLATYLFIFRFRNARYAAFATHMDNAREYLRSQNIPRAVRRQIMAYYSYSWNTHRSLDSEEALHLMPKHLQSKVVSTLKASRIKQVCFLAKESIEFINLLAAALTRQVYSPSDPIIEPKFNAQMFFVVRGSVVTSTFDGSNPKECQTGDFFADSCLLFPEKFEEKAVAKTFCELYILAKDKFDDAMDEFYREMAADVRSRMTETLEKYLTQLCKTKKLLGMRSKVGSARMVSIVGGTSHTTTAVTGDSRHGVHWRLPGSVFRIHWDAAQLLALIYIAFEVPYFSVFISMAEDKIIFHEQPEFSLRYFLTLAIEIFFGVNIILRSRFLAHLDPIVMLPVEDPALIFAAYKASGFYLDLIAWLPVGAVLETMATASGHHYSGHFRLVRLLRLREVPLLLWSICDYYSVSSKIHLVILLLLGVTFTLHVVGCTWFAMAWGAAVDTFDSSVMEKMTDSECLHHATHFNNCSWVIFDCYAQIGDVFPAENPGSMYLASFAYLRSVYWAIVTLTGVGYGDIVAYTTAETLFAALWVFAGGVLNFGVVGAMSSTISNAMAMHHHHMEKLNTLNSLLERMDISEKLSGEIRHFYHHEFVGRKEAYESQLLSHLPDQLCYQISSLLHSEAVKCVALFDSASIEFLKEVTGKFRHRSFQNGETICLDGDICREFYIFLRGSKVNVFFRSRKVPVRALHDGDSYGVSAFLLRQAHPATLIAASLVHASVMTRDQFDVIQRKFDDDLKDMKEEAQTLWIEQQNGMRRIIRNLEKLKLQPHLMQTTTLFYHGEVSIGAGNRNEDKTLRNSHAMRNNFISIWNAVITLWNVYNAIFVIFRICFHSHIHFSSGTNTIVWTADLVCDVFFAVDVYLRLYYFGLAETSVGNLLTRQKVDKQYFRSITFKWDLFASLPVYTPFTSGSLVASLSRVPRLVRCVDLWVYLDDVIVQVQQHFASRNVSAYLSPAKLMIVLVLMAHYTGCIFFWISEHECQHVERCWMAHDHLIHEYHHSMPILYVKSFYWAITTLLLVGSQESIPRDAAGTLWTGFTCLCCTFIIGHIVGEISELILELGKEAKQYKSRIASFEGFAKEHHIPETLRERIRFFFRLQFEHTHGLDLHNTVHDLSANLRLKLMLEIYGSSISLLPISRFLASSQINNLALRLQSELFIPGDNILVEGTFGSRLCTLRKGVAAAFWTSSAASVTILMESALFGEIAFFLPGQRRLATVRATTSCEVLYVTKHDWHELWTTNGDLSDIQIQKHALHAILTWVHGRLRRYQKDSLRIARKAKRLLVTRQTHPRQQITTTAAKGTIRSKSRLSAVQLTHNASTNALVSPFSAPTATSQPFHSAVENRRLSLASEMQLLEKKTKYLQSKTDRCVKQFYSDIEAMQGHRRSSSMMSTRSHRHNSSVSKGRSNSSSLYRSMIGDTAAPIAHRNSGIKASVFDIRVLQFMVSANPINKYVFDGLPDDYVRGIETECWARFKLLAEAEYNATKLAEQYAPTETTSMHTLTGPEVGQQQVKIQPAKNRSTLLRTRSFRYDEQAIRRRNLPSLDTPALDALGKRSTGPGTLKMWKALAVAAAPKLSSLLLNGNGAASQNRRLSTTVFQAPHSPWGTKPGQKEIHTRLTRSHSLSQFGQEYFEKMRCEDTSHLATKVGHLGFDFKTLQRTERPQYSAHLRLFHRYRKWRERKQVSVQPELLNTTLAAISHNHRNGAIPNTPSMREAGASKRKSQLIPTGSRLQLSAHQAVQAAKREIKVKEFVKLVEQIGKTWDLVMLMVAIYHLFVTPFKVCYAQDLSVLPDAVLRGWSGLEVFMDVLCMLDVGHKLWHASLIKPDVIKTSATSRQSGLRHALASSPALRVDILAMLPLEILLFAATIHAPTAHEAPIANASRTAWWTSRWLWRMNRLLLAGRIGPISEQLFQYIIYETKVSVNESLLYFLRGLVSYLAMGHLLACMWFLTSELGFHHYGTSWLSTSGMLTFISSVTPSHEKAGRILSENSGAFNLEDVSLVRKYMRSLLFSMECISTLFYGDILSMNPLELVVEIGITFWSIYIFGALVGAQSELLDAHGKRKADFEQGLGEMQLYLEQNAVPKDIKRQVKTYYARLWRRRKGESDFAAVEKASRRLYEDVVLATLHNFAAQVKVFRPMDDQFLRALLACLHYVVCSEKEDVFVVGDVDRSMYFIATGRIAVKMGSSEITRGHGEFFGELALLYGISRLETCVALTVTELYRLDHEPYEHLLLEFPEYRTRNKLAWTTFSSASARDRALVEEALRCFRRARPTKNKVNAFFAEGTTLDGNSVPSILDLQDIAANAGRIDAQLPHSYIYQSAMELFAKLGKLDPVEAKDMFLKIRDGARRQLKVALGVGTARDDTPHSHDAVHSFHSRSATPRNDNEDLSNNVEGLEAVTALSRPNEEQKRTEAMKSLPRSPNTDSKFR